MRKLFIANFILIATLFGCHPVTGVVPNAAKSPTVESAWDYSDKAKAEGRDEDWAAARKDIEEAIKLDPNEPDFHNFYAAILIKTNPKAARSELKLAIKLSGRSTANSSDRQKAAAYTNLSMLDINLRDLKAAEEDARMATRLAPEDAHAWNNLGVALLKQKKFDGAISALKKSMDLDPDSEHPKRNYQDALNHDVGP